MWWLIGFGVVWVIGFSCLWVWAANAEEAEDWE